MSLSFLSRVLPAFVMLTAAAVLTGCQPLPPMPPREPVRAVEFTPDNQLQQSILALNKAHPGKTGMLPLFSGYDAFVARLALVDHAQDSIDVQYYIWNNDITGRLLFNHIYKAADRGVHVRILLDDNNTKGDDELLLALNQHKNIEVRLFNPFMQRNFRAWGFITDFSRLNRRMHNKSFTVDGVVSVLGGRNIGDEYFSAGTGVSFADLDVLAVGDLVPKVTSDFNRYWQSDAAYPIDSIIDSRDLERLAFNAEDKKDKETQRYLERLSKSELAQSLKQGNTRLYWTEAQFFSDDPAKAAGKGNAEDNVLHQLLPILTHAEKKVDLVSPYFVPTERGVELLGELRERQVAVTVLTNSLSATDVAPVHSGYARYRKDMLKKGIRVLELKKESVAQMRKRGRLKANDASLHAKTFAVDDRLMFIGSFNMDPRSADLNTEMGVVFDAPVFARRLSEILASDHPDFYDLSLDDKNNIIWHTIDAQGRDISYDTEPESSFGQRALVRFFSWLPIESLL